jgi:hypothetical protein
MGRGEGGGGVAGWSGGEEEGVIGLTNIRP